MNQHTTEPRFGICIQNQGCEDLELGKVYQVLADESAAQEDHLRVIDESGEDYLYPADYFVPIALPQKTGRVLLSALSSFAAA